ncbi:uncharacterized protein LOC126317092 [Schistocerca gregaria]|uniref:uncharacterized protein LOC126317092 n=1 Tax=Schistocerca gregaria TaxID=7010 RepID=UPI00211EA853|nr:uncharacterized protein LOC126317092 [Schistocerca gregaria]
MRLFDSFFIEFSQRNYSTASKPATFWKHPEVFTSKNCAPKPPPPMHGLSSEQVAKARQMRHQDPKYYTTKKLARIFKVHPKKLLDIAPLPNTRRQGERALVEARRKLRVTEGKDVKRTRLAAWWHKQIKQIPELRERRKLYVRRRNRSYLEIDVDLSIKSDKRDERADIRAETVRNEKRKNMMMNRKG